jgi:hypothetical protein
MTWLGVALALTFSALALVYVLWPLLKTGPTPVMVEDDRLSDLLARKDATLAAIKELEFDYRVGKLSEEDYNRYDQRLRRQAMALIQQIEQLAPESNSADKELEEEIARRRKTSPTPGAVRAGSDVSDATIEAEILRRRKAIQPTPALVAPPVQVAAVESATKLSFCTNCGNRLDPQHNFCGVCGAPVGKPLPQTQ